MPRSCPKCKSTDYNNRNFVLMINECGHPLCRNCVDTLFSRNSYACPQCGKTLKKSTFWEQTLDDPLIEKEVHFRKKLHKVFNLKETDFPNLRAYNDYLEMVETLVFNLANDIDVEATNQKVKEFEKANEELILVNRTKKSADEDWIQQQIDQERRFQERIQAYAKIDSGDTKTTVNAKDVIEELRTSSEPAAFIINLKQKKQRELEAAKQAEPTKVSLSASLFSEPGALGSSAAPPGSPYHYEPVQLQMDGPSMPESFDFEQMDYLKHIREASEDQLAGGYHPIYGCYRAILEARMGILMDDY